MLSFIHSLMGSIYLKIFKKQNKSATFKSLYYDGRDDKKLVICEHVAGRAAESKCRKEPGEWNKAAPHNPL